MSKISTSLAVYDPTPTNDPAKQVYTSTDIFNKAGSMTNSGMTPDDSGKSVDLNALAKATQGMDKKILYILLAAFALLGFVSSRKK